MVRRLFRGRPRRPPRPGPPTGATRQARACPAKGAIGLPMGGTPVFVPAARSRVQALVFTFMSHPVDLLRRALAAEPSRPLVTFYDDATGERVEFSVKTFDNWVAKTANLLVDGLGAEPGAKVVLALPLHWQTAV